MNYHLRSFKTRSYWAYAFLSVDSLKTFVAVVAGIWTFVDIFDVFNVIVKNEFSIWLLVPLILIGIIAVIVTRPPVNKITYKSSSPDVQIEVKIADLLNVPGQKVISTNTTFDTDISNGIISINSLQGQFTRKYYDSNISALDREIDRQLITYKYKHKTVQKNGGKLERYDFGSTIKLKLADEYFYWFAMADMNENNTASAKLRNVEYALEKLWKFVATKGEKLDTVIPVVGAGLARLSTSKKKLITVIAQSFITASEDQIFAEKLTIVIHPADVDKWKINLFEVKDLLRQYLP